MKSFLTEIEKKFQTLETKFEVPDSDAAKDLETKINDPDAIIKVTNEEELEEANVTGALDGGAGPPRTPGAFMSKKSYDKKKKKMKWASVSEAMDKKYEKLIESYSKFAMGNNSKSSPVKTVNETIRQVSKRLQEIETLINYTGRLKKESGMTRGEYGKSTFTALNKISERLLKMSERIRSLGE